MFAVFLLSALLLGAGVASATTLGVVPVPQMQSNVKANRPFTVTGRACAWAGSDVTLSFEHLEGALWRLAKSVHATARDDGAYAVSVSLADSGTWRVNARYTLGANIANSGYRKLRVHGAPGPQTRCSASGRVSDSEGHGIAGIDVTAWAKVVLNDGTSIDYYNTAVTGPDGMYKVPDLVAGRYDVTIADSQNRYPRAGDRDVVVNVARDETGVDFTGLARGGAVTGHARDETGSPVVDAEVELHSRGSHYSYGEWTTTDADGVYSFVNESVSSYSVYFDDHAGVKGDMICDSQTTQTVQVVAGGTVDGPDATYIEGGFINGTVVDGNKGLPIGDINIDILTPGSISGYDPVVSDWTYGGGVFGVLVRPGSYAVRTTDPLGIFDPKTVSGPGGAVLVGAGETVNLPPIAESSSRSDVHYISGTVTDAETDEPIDGAEVEAWKWSYYSGSHFDRYVQTGSDGRYALLVPGKSTGSPEGERYELSTYTWGPDYSDQYTSVNVKDIDVSHDFALRSDRGTGSVSGRITDGHGNPLPSVRVDAEAVSGYGSTSGYSGGDSETDANGYYTVGGLRNSDNVKVRVNPYSEYGGENRPAVAYSDHPYFEFPSVSGYDWTSISGYDRVSVQDDKTTSGIDQTLPVGGHIRATAESTEGPMGGVRVTLEYLHKGQWTQVGRAFTHAGVMDGGDYPLWPGDYRVSYTDIFGRIDGSGDTRMVHLGEDQTATVSLVKPRVAATVSLPGGGDAKAQFDGLASSVGTLSVEPTTSVPSLPTGVFQVLGSTFEVAFSGSFSGVWTLTFPYDPTLPDALASHIVVNHFSSSALTWETLTPVSIDTVHHTVTVQTTSLSPFAVTIPEALVYRAQFTAPTVSESAPYVGASVSIATTMTDIDTSAALGGQNVRLLSSHDSGSTWTTESATVSSLAGGKYQTSVIATQTSAVSYRFGVASALPYFTGARSSGTTVTALPTNTSWLGASLPAGATSIVLAYGGSTVATGSLEDTHGATLDTTGDVVVQMSVDNVSFSDSALVASKVATGSYSVSVAPTVKTYYRFHFKGDSTNNPSYSASVFVAPQVKLTTPTAKSKVKPRKSFNVTGKVYPAHGKGAKTVKVFCERQKGKKWVKFSSVWAKNTPKGSYSIYTATFKLKAGTYRFHAAAPADADHADTGNTKSVKVKVK